ncbi:hypothetical protein B0H14DRAFT_3512737 [Mycena olivaceomarginata]|nr:hypothetical protein B0H14DRAFT_3512737 [Mycena olivaceomarginata]
MAPTTTETDREELHFVITYVKSLSLPSISKTKMMHRIVPRGLYASLSVDNGSDPYKYHRSMLGPA